jgi:hypothetical protein
MLLSLWCRGHRSNLALDFFLDLIDCETRRGLTGRIFHECIEESGSVGFEEKWNTLPSPRTVRLMEPFGALRKEAGEVK